MSIEDTSLQLPDGTPTTLGAFSGDPLVVILVRYFGCLPCQEYVVEVDAIRDSFGADAKVVAVGGSADFQAAWLREKKGVQMPLLLDPDQAVRAAVDLGDLTAGQMSKLQGAKNYLKALFGGFRPQRPTKDAQKAPGVAVFDADLQLKWVYRGEFLGDYPTADQVRSAIDAQATPAA